MTEFEEIMLKLKMVELTQNQSSVNLLAAQVNTAVAREHAVEGAIALNIAIDYTEKLLKRNE